MTETEKQSNPKTLWHDWFGNLFKVSLIPTGLDVATDVPVMKQLPEADIVIIRRHSKIWTKEQLKRLPDGIRHTRAKHVLIELKFTESINEDAICQIGGYYKFYKINQKLKPNNQLKCFLVSSKTPRKSTLKRFQYYKTKYPGVFKSQGPICGLFPIISLNDLSDAPHNILFKLFASKKKETINATNKVRDRLYNQLPEPLQNFLSDYIERCLIEGGSNMDYLNLTQEERKKLRQEWLSKYSTEELLSGRTPSEVLSNYSPSEVLSNYSPSEVLSYISQDQIIENFSTDQLSFLAEKLNSRIQVQSC
jgi:hypothetical protein